MQIISEPLMILFVFSMLCFGLALLFGLLGFKWRAWQYVDLLYYPLAAIGVTLLFATASEQRKLLELTQLEQTYRNRLEALVSQRPDVRFNASRGLVEAGFKLLATIPE